jgi:hypothetical protein
MSALLERQELSKLEYEKRLTLEELHFRDLSSRDQSYYFRHLQALLSQVQARRSESIDDSM